jgi:chromosome segregation ATPase
MTQAEVPKKPTIKQSENLKTAPEADKPKDATVDNGVTEKRVIELIGERVSPIEKRLDANDKRWSKVETAIADSTEALTRNQTTFAEVQAFLAAEKSRVAAVEQTVMQHRGETEQTQKELSEVSARLSVAENNVSALTTELLGNKDSARPSLFQQMNTSNKNIEALRLQVAQLVAAENQRKARREKLVGMFTRYPLIIRVGAIAVGLLAIPTTYEGLPDVIETILNLLSP